MKREAKQGAHSLGDGVGGLAADAQALIQPAFIPSFGRGFIGDLARPRPPWRSADND